jgi:hypothetical protein
MKKIAMLKTPNPRTELPEISAIIKVVKGLNKVKLVPSNIKSIFIIINETHNKTQTILLVAYCPFNNEKVIRVTIKFNNRINSRSKKVKIN